VQGSTPSAGFRGWLNAEGACEKAEEDGRGAGMGGGEVAVSYEGSSVCVDIRRRWAVPGEREARRDVRRCVVSGACEPWLELWASDGACDSCACESEGAWESRRNASACGVGADDIRIDCECDTCVEGECGGCIESDCENVSKRGVGSTSCSPSASSERRSTSTSCTSEGVGDVPRDPEREESRMELNRMGIGKDGMGGTGGKDGM
jgi:hypothetical protein